tara:strand:+ start:64 stop:291 length:228 start_codon:yes stop_codon:yes gene_type:complete
MSKGSKSRIQNQDNFNKGFDKIFTKEPNIPELNLEWQCYCNKINEIREFYFMDSKIFSAADKERFAKAHKKKYNI